MALDVKTFRVRAISALFFVAVMCAGLFVNWYTFTFLFLFIMIGCCVEFKKIMVLLHKENHLPYLLLAIPYFMLPIFLLVDLATAGGLKAISSGGMKYLPLIPCTIIFSIWINDTMAYIVGSFIGKTPFSSISPKKTWEGTIGGAILCVVLISLLSRLFNVSKEIPIQHFIAISLLCAVFGTLGDLLESKIKRMAGIKDSGRIMPGHGGFMDRFDSLLIAVPFVWLYVRFFM